MPPSIPVNDSLRSLARLDPGAERGDLLVGPGAVAGHVALLEALQDGLGVLLDVLVAPQVEGEAHALLVLLAEQRLDVALVAERLGVAHRSPFQPSDRR